MGRPKLGEIIEGRYDSRKFTYWRPNMSDIVTERSGNILSIQLNRPAKKNAMTSSMYITMAELLDAAAKDDQIRVVLWHGAGNSFSAGNDIEDFMKNPPAPGESPQAQLIHALINFEKPLIAAVQGSHRGRNNHVGSL
jgi:enoyl-CoA hydratase/carnithine racemase